METANNKMNRTRDYYRHQRDRRIKHAMRIAYDVYGYTPKPTVKATFDTPGKMAKGKVHCSCWLCRPHGLSMQDRRNLDKFNYRDD